MSTLPRSQKNRWLWVSAGAALVALTWFVPSLHTKFVTILSPFVRVVRLNAERGVSVAQLLIAIPQLARENGVLSQKVNELTSLSIINDELGHENDILRRELGFLETQNSQGVIPAHVISRSSSIVGQTIMINKGLRDGLIADMAVVAQGYYVGRVEQANETTSTISLVTDATFLLPVVLQNSRSVALLKGGAEGLILTEIPRDITITPDEGVVTSPLGSIVKGGIPIGRVSQVLGSKSDIFQSARLNSPIDFSRLELVFGVR